LHHEGLANELAAKALFARGKNDIARPYLEAAMRAYSSWGASAKVEQLRARFPDFFGGVVGPHSRAAGAPSRGARSLDAVAIVRAAEAIAGEIDLDKLLERLLRTVLEVAGADSGALVLGREGELLVAATMSVEGAEIGEMRPLGAAQNVAAAVVQYVARTRQPVVVGRGATGTPFEADPRLVLAAPRSFLGLPLVHREGLTGVLYLENRHVEEAFSEGRAELLAMLSSQAAIAIENAVLVADVRKRTEELARANDGLREELSRREAAEAERAALEQEIIDMQRRRLAELSAPLVPITSSVMVIPIVGTVDAPRAEELMRVAMEGASQKGLKALILDITGVSVVDSHVAGRLLEMVRALQLLGTEAVVTGIRGEVARALVALDIDFGSKVATRSTPQAGIAYALGREGRRVK
jgi:GAF domain-containing protein